MRIGNDQCQPAMNNARPQVYFQISVEEKLRAAVKMLRIVDDWREYSCQTGSKLAQVVKEGLSCTQRDRSGSVLRGIIN